MTDERQAERDAVAALRSILDGTYPRPVGTHYFPDKRISKHDQCVHGVWMYEICEGCLDTFVSATLDAINHTKESSHD